jgi:4,5-DOPA dioxygenase extradiol|tara:strand:+ start:149701 stop:149856 length:156 start_codon:yes stop_codon:yes gene_type:complete
LEQIKENYAFDWATEANENIKTLILNSDHQKLSDFKAQGKAFDWAIPTPEH